MKTTLFAVALPVALAVGIPAVLLLSVLVSHLLLLLAPVLFGLWLYGLISAIVYRCRHGISPWQADLIDMHKRGLYGDLSRSDITLSNRRAG